MIITLLVNFVILDIYLCIDIIVNINLGRTSTVEDVGFLKHFIFVFLAAYLDAVLNVRIWYYHPIM